MSTIRTKRSYFPPGWPPYPSTASYLKWCKQLNVSRMANPEKDWGWAKLKAA